MVWFAILNLTKSPRRNKLLDSLGLNCIFAAEIKVSRFRKRVLVYSSFEQIIVVPSIKAFTFWVRYILPSSAGLAPLEAAFRMISIARTKSIGYRAHPIAIQTSGSTQCVVYSFVEKRMVNPLNYLFSIFRVFSGTWLALRDIWNISWGTEPYAFAMSSHITSRFLRFYYAFWMESHIIVTCSRYSATLRIPPFWTDTSKYLFSSR